MVFFKDGSNVWIVALEVVVIFMLTFLKTCIAFVDCSTRNICDIYSQYMVVFLVYYL